jgi:erythrin-vacuolar iron transport family protein
MLRGSITGGGTFLGGIFHTLPFLIANYRTALVAAIIVVSVELVALADLRATFFRTSFSASFVSVTAGGAVIAALSAALGAAAA